ncbi:3'(2'),5'-bisphosphate nucleotidase CysQ [uncultured Gammaproteobacteria bacterium]
MEATIKLMLPALQGLAMDAARAINRVAADARASAKIKADGSPVTGADLAAEEAILPGLRRMTPDLPIVSEEACSGDQLVAGVMALTLAESIAAAGLFWLVDPLDGTREFLADNGEYTVNIALVTPERPLLGVICLPATGEVYWGGDGLGAWRQLPNQEPVAIKVRLVPPTGPVVLASRRHGDTASLDRFLADWPGAQLANAGSSLKFCRLAEGRADLYPRFGPTCEWDTAAGHAILAAAGGSVRTLDGQPLAYGKLRFHNPEFVARA